MLLQSVLDINYDPQTNVVDVQVSHLRRRVDRRYRASVDRHRAQRRLYATGLNRTRHERRHRIAYLM